MMVRMKSLKMYLLVYNKEKNHTVIIHVDLVIDIHLKSGKIALVPEEMHYVGMY